MCTDERRARYETSLKAWLAALASLTHEKMSESIATYFADVFEDLSGRRPFCRSIAHDISSAPAFGHAKRMIITECDSDNLTLNSVFRASWVVDHSGCHVQPDPFRNCPQSDRLPASREILPDYEIENPRFRFSADGQRIRIGLHLGPNWYVVKETNLRNAGLPDPKSWVELKWT